MPGGEWLRLRPGIGSGCGAPRSIGHAGPGVTSRGNGIQISSSLGQGAMFVFNSMLIFEFQNNFWSKLWRRRTRNRSQFVTATT